MSTRINKRSQYLTIESVEVEGNCFCTCDAGGTAVAGQGGVSWSLVDATELPPAGEVA